jgi:hypothetical protein
MVSSAKHTPLDKKVAMSSEVETIKGDGRIVSSGTTVQGMDTRFKEQIEIGDTLIVRHPQSLAVEERVVTSVMSQRSLTLHSPFSSDFVSTTEYSIRRDSVWLKSSISSSTSGIKKEERSHGPDEDEADIPATEALQEKLRKRLEEEENILTYREKVGMGYRTVSMKVNNNLSKEDLLNLQIKKTHDRYC